MPSDNPFWFGYYPGTGPVKKRPSGGGQPTQIPTPDFGFDEAIDQAIEAIDKPGEFVESFPKQVWEWIKEDWKQSFNIGTSPSADMGGQELYQFSGEEVADVRGVYVQINLYDLVTNPTKTIGKFFEKSLDPLNPFKAGATLEGEFFTDLATNAEVAMWRSLLKNNGASRTPWDDYFRDTFSPAASPLDLNEHTIFARKAESGAKAFSFSLDASGNPVYDTVAIERDVDVYQQVAESHLNFVLGKKSAFTRNKAYRGFSTSVIDAAATELSQKRTDLDRIFRADPSLDQGLSLKIDAFLGEHELMGYVGKVGKNIGSLGDTIAKVGFTQQITIADISGDLTKIKSSAEDALRKIQEVKTTLQANPLERRRFERDIRELESYLEGARDFAQQYLGRPATDVLGRLTQAEVINSQIAQFKSKFSGNRYGGGVQDRYLESIGRRYFEGPQSLLRQNFTDPTNPGALVMSRGYSSLGRLYDYNKRIFLQEAGRDLADTIGKGKLSNQYLWFGSLGDLYIGNLRIPLSEIGLIRDRLQIVTPGYWTKQLLDRTHSFGLVYNEDMKDKVLHPVFNKLPWIFENKFTEDFEYKVGGVVAGRIKAQFTGSENLKNFHTVWAAAKNGQLVASGTGSATVWVKDVAINNRAKLLLLNGDPLALGAGYQIVGITDDPAKFLVSMAQIRAELASKLGLTLDASGKILETPENLAKLDAFYEQLQKRLDNRALLNPFKEKYGILDIYAHKLSVIQQQIYTKLGLNKVAQAFAKFKTALAEKIAQAVAKLGSSVLAKLGIAALSTATAGLGAVLAPAVEKLIQLTVAKLIDKSKELLRAIIRGNFGEALDQMMEDALSTAQKVLACGCLVPIILSFSVLMLLGNVLVSIPPFDRTRSRSTTASTVPTLPAPPSDTLLGSNCPLRTGTKTLLSYNPGTDGDSPDDWRTGHGSKWYWTDPGIGFTNKYFSIPFLDSPTGFTCPDGFCSPRDDPPYDDDNPMSLGGDNICARLGRTGCNFNTTPMNKSVSWYGYAMDISGSSGVYAPSKISCAGDVSVDTWTVRGSPINTNYGCGVILQGTGSDGKTYKLFLLHLASCPSRGTTITAGKGIASVLPSANHVHIELSVDNVPKKPEDCMCTGF